ncbi:hypothetical protein FACS1894184_16150 [Clostridia bacterium]|nr:hypothetical protein FACS1894184_16150 [Clostridia bacterium]
MSEGCSKLEVTQMKLKDKEYLDEYDLEALKREAEAYYAEDPIIACLPDEVLDILTEIFSGVVEVYCML